jgi:MoxR-like ATPase
MDGTYPLPEAQVDRFLMRVTVGYPDAKAESAILEENGAGPGLETLRPVASAADVQQLIASVNEVQVSPALRDYIVAVTGATRRVPEVRLGASPRASLGLMRASRAKAAMTGRQYATADDVKSLVLPVLGHRILLSSQATMAGVSIETILEKTLATVPVPTNLWN